MMKIMNSDKEEMQRLCNFVRENVEKHDYEKCKEKIMRAMSEFPHAAEPHNLMGIVLEKEGNHVTAMRHFRAAWELDPAYPRQGRIWKPLERFRKMVATCLMKATVKML